MPHINRIRVNNVRYNFGTQFYDDFIMRFDCKNVLYDLANGGGKSVLLLLLLQNLIPNCTLDDKQPVEKLFRGSNGSTVIHSLIEWRLDDYLVKDDYRYMLTGFCARKAREDEGQNTTRDVAAIEYFNYVIFYRHYNDNDIVNLPLSDGRERITYPGLKNYLKNLSRRDYQLQVHLFERKGEYQRFISRYGLYESEWEIIRGINKTEGHVRTYFETHYRTTRKVVEDLLIEEIIQKAFYMRTSDGENPDEGDTALMADTLYEIRDQLTELTRKKAQIHHYDQQQEVLQSLGERIRTLDNMYQEEAHLRYEIARAWQTVLLNSRTKARDLAVAEKEKEKAAGQMEEYSRKLETARIQSSKEQLADLETATDQYKKELEELQNQQALARDDLNLRESMNDYLEYLEEQMKFQSISHTINHAAGGQQELLELLKSYTEEWSGRYDQRCRDMDSRILEYKQAIHLNNAKLASLGEEERESDRMLAVLEHQIEEGRSQEKEYLRKFGRLREQSGLLVIEEVGKALREHHRRLEQQEDQLRTGKKEMEAGNLRLQEVSLRLEQLEPELVRVRETIRELSDFMKEWKVNRDRLQKLLDIYHVQTAELLKQQLFERYRRVVYELEGKRQQILILEKRIRQLTEGNPLNAPEDVRKFMEYVRSCHGITCVYGAEYLKGLDLEERRHLLERMPFIPYTVILKDGFSKVAADALMKEKDFGDHLIPVTGLETVMSEEIPVDEAHLLCAGKGSGYYLDERLLIRERRRSEEELSELKRQLTRMQDQMETYEKDMEDVSGFLLMYEGQKEERHRALSENEALERKLLEEQEASRREQRNLSERSEQLQREQETLEKQLAAAREQYEILQQLKNVNDTLTDLRRQLVDEEQKHAQLSMRKHEQQLAIEKLEAGNRELTERCETAGRQKEMLVREWTEEWQIYADVNETASQERLWRDLTDDELRAAFLGVRDAYEKEHLDLVDKKQLMESYARSMERLLKNITGRNQQPERLARLYEEGQLYTTDEEQILSVREALMRTGEKIDSLRQRLADMEADKNRLCGSVTQAVTTIEEKYGVFKEVNLNDQSYENYVRNMTQLYNEVSDKCSAASRNIERLTRDTYFLEGLRRDLERMMTLCHVPADLTKDTWGPNVNLKRKYEELLGQYEHLQSQHFARREAFEKDKARAVSSLHLLGAEGLASEIRDHLTLPEDAEAAKHVMEEIDETIQLIDIEKMRVGKNMEDLMSIKENFEEQCLQICQNIRMELDKLPKMSVIVMDGERIQMVGLSIPYIKETFYKQQMAAYIDEIVKISDTFGTQEEKLRYIRQQLAWKRLFAVIVTDMNAIRLTLYKRERIVEQSRYLKYEEAVGSTGQSQGIYIQFLIAIIHYISCIHAGASSGEALKKVIFIDNPFGAAKDIYIWEPIFALLKTNDVQLIVPARGATPAITGKFDVNYVLGQKLMNNRQQTIVVDYHSNVVIEEMEYVKIDYEQEVFDFV